MALSKNSPWPPLQIHTSKIAYKDLVKTVSTYSAATDSDVHAALSRYLVIRSAGYLENVRVTVAQEYSRQVSQVRVWNRLKTSLWSGMGVAPNQLLSFVESFDSQWRTELESFFDEDDSLRRRSLGSLVSARKRIAHGGSDQLSASEVLKWPDLVIEISDWLVDRFDPQKS